MLRTLWAVYWEGKMHQQCLRSLPIYLQRNPDLFPQDSKNQATERSFHICNCGLLSRQYLAFSALCL